MPGVKLATAKSVAPVPSPNPFDALQNNEVIIHPEKCLGGGADDCTHDLTESAFGSIVASVDAKAATQVTSVRGKAIRFEPDSVDGLIVHAGSNDDKLESSAIPLKSDGILQKVDPKAHSHTRGSCSQSSQENGELIDSAPCNKSKDLRGTCEMTNQAHFVPSLLPGQFGLLRIAHRKLCGEFAAEVSSSTCAAVEVASAVCPPWLLPGALEKKKSFISCLAGLDLRRTAHLTLSGVCSIGAFSPNGVADVDTVEVHSSSYTHSSRMGVGISLTPADMDEEVLLGYMAPVLTSPCFPVGDSLGWFSHNFSEWIPVD
ncbi:hypothetical protein Nepgr_024020 [Nepenthes gracilis]|uniref:Uncharacterized protein n=1 Tax=Nepenthes gracilis TaxID=150966 RepID=A0AAD3T3X2_NEPGR|nr:hypothetical protein Nepgr_024020 [Nepenthes gracilis]